MREMLLRSTARLVPRPRRRRARAGHVRAQVGQGDVRGCWVRGQPSPAPADARTRTRRRRTASRTPVSAARTLHCVTPAGPEDVPVEFVSALRSLRRVTVRPEVDPRRGARSGAHRPLLRGAHRRGAHGPTVGRRRRARVRPVRRPVRPRRAGGLGRPLPPGHARARDARGRGRRGPAARRGRVDVVHRRARGRPASTRTPPAGPSPGCCRRASAPSSARSEQTELEIRASWTAADEDLGPHLQAWGDPAVHRSRAANRCPTASSPSGRGADRRPGGARSQDPAQVNGSRCR